MARFSEVDEAYSKDLMEYRNSDNTKKATKSLKNLMTTYCVLFIFLTRFRFKVQNKTIIRQLIMGYHDLFSLDSDIQLGFASLDITYLD